MGGAKVASTPAFVIRKSRIAGRGAFALRRIRKGERLIEYTGERITHAVADVRYDDEHIIPHHTFLFTVNRTTVIDAAVDGNESRFINHSCDPNCESVIDHGRVYIEAIRRIRPGEELTYDYAYVRDGTETEEEETGKYGVPVRLVQVPWVDPRAALVTGAREARGGGEEAASPSTRAREVRAGNEGVTRRHARVMLLGTRRALAARSPG